MKKITLAASLSLLLAACSTPPRPETPKPECVHDSDCSAGQLCGPAGKCTAECAQNSDCDSPEVCQSGACALPAGVCRSSAECGANQTCGASDECVRTCLAAADCAPTEACIAGGCLKLATQIAQCNLNSDCTGTQACVNGRCAAACANTRDCPAGSECVNSSCVLPTLECFAATDCASAEACSPGGQCVTSCTSQSSCASTEACSNGACVTTGSSVAAISGSVAITGQTAAGGITVKLEGNHRASAVTGNDGSYKFDGLAAGVYRLTYSAAATVEGTATRDLFAKVGTTTTVGTVTFTPAGAITGNATLQNKTNHTGISVLVTGTSRSTVTDAAGNFRLDGLAAGTYSLVFSAAGYLPQTRNNVAVTFNGTASVTGVTLNEPATATGLNFAFVSTPPTTARVGREYIYQAQATGGGVASVTYAITVGPTGMTIDSSTGTVSYTPSQTDSHTVAIAASGGGVTIYQVYTLTVARGVDLLDPVDAYKAAAVDGGAWLSDGANLFFFDGGAVGRVAGWQDTSSSGTVGSFALLNGAEITDITYPGGDLTSFSGPFGTMSATWEGGVAIGINGVQTHTVTARALRSIPISAFAFDGENTLTAISYPTGKVDSIADGRKAMTALRIPGGVATSVAANVLTDSNATWTANQFVGSCIIDLQRSVSVSITANDATTLTVGATTDLAQLFPVGGRFLIAACANPGNLTVTLEDTTAAFATTLVTRELGIYTKDLYVNRYTIASVPSATTLTFPVPFGDYLPLMLAASNGTYAIENANNTYDVTLTDSTATFPAGLATTNRVGFDNFSTTYQIISNTATTITYRIGVGNELLLNAARAGRNWVLNDTNAFSPSIATTLTVQNALTPGALTNQYLLVDKTGASVLILGNTANTITARVGSGLFPLNAWLGSLMGVAPGLYQFPNSTVTTSAALVPGSMTDRQLYFVDFSSSNFQYRGDISSNTSSTVRVNAYSCSTYGPCAGSLTLSRSYPGIVAAPGRNPPSPFVDFRISVSGSPSWGADTLIGRTIALDANRTAVGTVIGNGSDTIDVEVDEADFAAFQQLQPGGVIWLSDTRVGNTIPMRVRITDQAGGFTANQWAGYSVITPSGLVLGTVSANSTNTLDVTVTNQSAFASFPVGSRYGLATTHAGGNNCNNPWVKANVQLAGATLTAGAHDFLYAANSGTTQHQVSASTSSGATLLVCADAFDTFLGGIGRMAVLTTNDRVAITLTDSSAAMTPNAHAGHALTVSTGGTLYGFPTGTVTSNTATSLTLGALSAATAVGLAEDLTVGGSFVASQSPLSEVPLTLHTAGGLTPGANANRLVEVYRQVEVDPDEFFVSSSDATKLTGGFRSAGTAMSFARASPAYKWLTFSAGLRIRVTDSTKAWTPNALIGRRLTLNGENFEITSNTATAVTAVSTDENALYDAQRATSYTISGYDIDGPIAALPNGDGLALTANGSRNVGVLRATQGGSITVTPPSQSAKTMTLTPKALTAAGTLAFNPTSVPGGFCEFIDSSWSFTANELVGSYLYVRNTASLASGAYMLLPIRSNTATTITTFGCTPSGSASAGKPYSISSARYAVSGATLTTNELAGKSIFVNGVELRVRSNTASEVHVVLPAGTGSADVAVDPVEPGGSVGTVYDGMPRELLTDIASDGANGYIVLAPSFYAHFNGTSWTRSSPTEAATLHKSGSVSRYEGTTIIADDAASYTPNELSGMKLLLPSGLWTVTSNTATTITVGSGTSSLGHAAVAPGTAYQVYRADGLGTGMLRSAYATSGALWIGTNEGLYKRVGASWTRYTVSSTESAAGLADGLPNDEVRLLLGLSANEVIMTNANTSGITRFNGTTWTRYTPANTESTAGANDGLFANAVTLLARDSAGAVWVGHYRGLSKLTGTVWSQHATGAGLFGAIYGMCETPRGPTFFGDDGAFRLLP